MKKKLLWVLPVLFSLAVHANELKNFDELKSAIQQGKNINVVTLLNECQSNKNSSRAVTTMTGIYRPQAFMIINDKISASDLHFTRNSPQHPERSVFEFVTYMFDSENKLTLSSQALDAINYSPLGAEHKLTCTINSSVKLFSDAHHVDLSLIEQ